MEQAPALTFNCGPCEFVLHVSVKNNEALSLGLNHSHSFVVVKGCNNV